MATAKKCSTPQSATKSATAKPVKVTAEDVLPYVRRRKVFSTGSVASQFNVSNGSATALVAILRIKRVIEKDGTASDGTSQWRYTG